MKKRFMQVSKISSVGIVILLLSLVAGCRFNELQDGALAEDSSAVEEKVEIEEVVEIEFEPVLEVPVEVKAAGLYLDYTPEIALQYADKKRVLFFHAGWCPTCIATNKEVNANLDSIPEGVVIFRIDYDTSDELKERYNVTYQDTFVQVDSEGDLIKLWNGGGLDGILSNVK
jgi:thioredoxin 1